MGKKFDNLTFAYIALTDNQFFIIGIGNEENNEVYEYATKKWEDYVYSDQETE